MLPLQLPVCSFRCVRVIICAGACSLLTAHRPSAGVEAKQHDQAGDNPRDFDPDKVLKDIDEAVHKMAGHATHTAKELSSKVGSFLSRSGLQTCGTKLWVGGDCSEVALEGCCCRHLPACHCGRALLLLQHCLSFACRAANVPLWCNCCHCLQLLGGANDATSSITKLAGSVTHWWAHLDPGVPKSQPASGSNTRGAASPEQVGVPL